MLFFCEECGEKIEKDAVRLDSNHIVCPNCSFSVDCMDKVKNVENSAGSKLMSADLCKQKVVKVLIVDDSKLIRRVIRDILTGEEGFIIVGEAASGAEALEMIKKVMPDVITLDLIMPGMDGLTVLKHIMIKEAKPVVMFSTLTQNGSRETFDALNYGAVDFLQKPSARKNNIETTRQLMIEKIRRAAEVKTMNLRYFRKKQGLAPELNSIANCRYITVIGASEGAYGSLIKIIPKLDPELPGAFIVILHSETKYLRAFADYLNEFSSLSVKYAENGEVLKGGCCYLSSGTDYITLEGSEKNYFLNVAPSPFPKRRGAINMLMFSLAESKKEKALAVLLTGTGDDGVEGALEIERNRGKVIVQTPASCLYKETVQSFIKSDQSKYQASDITMAEAINNHITLTIKGEEHECLTI